MVDQLIEPRGVSAFVGFPRAREAVEEVSASVLRELTLTPRKPTFFRLRSMKS